ncbi:YciI family protein [Chondromyces apiculatus]|uniref:Dgpfaetke n=1 Tax=Chondromyces apiculatus DSM 436 TaxID=1192034 RepID=A0A017SV03_9BACT|nr:YciI family protein [Chondromyces apiculatus]EYF00814.1 dgpfaetke [Chondromyces apiculatus DSM 436]
MRFLLIPSLIPSDTKAEADMPFDEKLFDAQMKYNEELHRAGVLVASEGLNVASKGAHVRFSGGKGTVVDGPFAETKELIAGFYLINVKSREEAIAWALRYPSGAADEVMEVRPLTAESDIPPELVARIADVAPTWYASVGGTR